MERKEFKKTLLIFGGAHGLLFMVIFPLLAKFFYPGTGTLELWLAREMLGGGIPYHDFASEYPPLALLSFLLPGLFFQNTIAYSWAFATELFICDLLAMFMIIDLAAYLKVSVRKTLVVYTLLIVATGPILVCRYDMLPAMLVLGALWAFIKGKNKLAWAAAGLGFAAKLYPLIILPIFIIHQLKNRQYRALVEGVAIFLAVLLAFSLPWVVIDVEGYGESWTYHLERGLHAESTYGTVLLTGQLLGMTSVKGDLNYGSWNLSSPLADRLADISFYITAVLLLAIYGRYAFKRSARDDAEPIRPEGEAARLLQYATLAVIVFMLANKVFSAQYLAWLCPLLPLVAGCKRYLVPALFIMAAVLTQYVFPYDYISFELGEALPVSILFIRNILLIIAAGLIAFQGSYQTPGTRALRPGG